MRSWFNARIARRNITAAIAIVVMFLTIPILPVHAEPNCSASVYPTCIARNVVIGGPYGQLTASRNMTQNWYATYANGTMYFDVDGLENTQQYYEFTVDSWGNGTMLVMFGGLTPFSTNQNPVATYRNGVQEFRFARDETGSLCVSYARGFCPGLGGGGILPNLLLGISLVFLIGVVIVAVESRVRRDRY